MADRSRQYFFIIFILLSGCRGDRHNEATTKDIAIEDITPGEVVHDSLTREQIKEIERIQHVLSEVTSSSLEETINNFKRDRDPQREIEIWSKMADAYERFAVNKHVEEHDKKEEAYQLILMRSMMTEADAIERVNIDYLSQDEIKEILSYYDAPPEPIRVLKK